MMMMMMRRMDEWEEEGKRKRRKFELGEGKYLSNWRKSMTPMNYAAGGWVGGIIGCVCVC